MLLQSRALRARVAVGLCIALVASLFPASAIGQPRPTETSGAALRIAVVRCADLTGETVPGLAGLLERSLWKSLANQPGVEVVQAPDQATRLLSAQITEVNRPAKRKASGQVEVVAELSDPASGAVTYRAVVRGGGFSRPGEAFTAQIERAITEAADEVAAQVVRSERLRGQVTRVERGTSATIDLGSDDGVAPGTELEVVRGDEAIGVLRLDRVTKHESTGLLSDVKAGTDVAAGDQVRLSSSPKPILPTPPPTKGKGGGRSWMWVVGLLAVGAIAAFALSGGGGGGVGNGQLYLVAADQQIPANGTSSTTVTATVRDAKGNPAPNGTKVRFQTNLGVIAPARVPTDNGVATATLTSAPTPGTATITAIAGTLRQTTTVEFTPAPGPGIAAHLSVSADPTEIAADETSTSTITATVTDKQHNPVPDGTLVKFSTSLGLISPATAVTAGGTAEATLRSGDAAGTAVVTAKVDQLVDTVQVEFVSAEPDQLVVEADPEQVPADGTSTSTITATVSDAQHNPVPDGTVVRFTTSLGVIGPASVDTVNGVAEATLHSGTTPGTANVTVRVKTLTERVKVTFVDATPAKMTVSADPEQISADGKSTSTITARVSDAQSNPVPDGTEVTFTTSLGTIDPGSAQTSGGVATATLRSGTRAGTATVTVKAGTLTRRATVDFLSTAPVHLAVVADPEEIAADGTSTSTITATVSDALHNPVPDGTVVKFTTSLGVVGPASVSTQSGTATATLHSGTDPGTAVVTVTAKTLTEQVEVEFLDTTAANLILQAEPKRISADGTSTSTITATVTDSQNNPVPDGTLVKFTTSLGVVGPSSATTTNGKASSTLTSTTSPGVATVTVKAGTLTRTVKVEFLDTTPALLTVTADPEEIPADGTSTSTITVTVKDAQNNPVPDGTLVRLTTSLGQILPATAQTQSGTATATLRSDTTAGTARVTARAGTLTEKVSVEFLDTTPALLTVTADPEEIAADGTSTSTITATVKDAQNDPVPDGTVVKFTTSLGDILPATDRTEGGTAAATLRSGTVPGTATVTVKVGTLTERATVDFVDTSPASLAVTASPEEIAADGTSTSTVTATVKDAQNDPVPDGTVVKFTTSLGTILPASGQTQDGTATATLTSGTTAGTATVTVKVGSLTEQADVEFLDTVPVTLTVAADPTEIPADGTSTSTITATVSDAQNNPVPDGTAVKFTTNLGMVGPGTVDTQDGTATATLTSSTTAGDAKVTVKAGTLTRTVTVKFVEGVPTGIVLSADPDKLPADGISTATVTALVSDSKGNPVPDGTVVRFTTSLGLIGPATTQTTDGVATATLHSAANIGTAWVTAKAGGVTERITVRFHAIN